MSFKHDACPICAGTIENSECKCCGYKEKPNSNQDARNKHD